MKQNHAIHHVVTVEDKIIIQNVLKIMIAVQEMDYVEKVLIFVNMMIIIILIVHKVYHAVVVIVTKIIIQIRD
jgi:hypothetical protein